MKIGDEVQRIEYGDHELVTVRQDELIQIVDAPPLAPRTPKLGDAVGNMLGVREFHGEIVGVNPGEYAVRAKDSGEFSVYNSRELHWDCVDLVWRIG